MQYIGDQDFVNHVESFLLSSKNHHAIIFKGSKGIGKACAAKQIIKNIISKQGGNEIYNLKWISAENNKSNKITIDQIRVIGDFLNHTNFDSKYKFIVIDAADDLNVNAANSLLKSLEEPNRNCYFILINHKPRAILPTIRSRCISFNFIEPSEDRLKEIIISQCNIGPEEALKYIILSSNNPGFAVYLATHQTIDFYQILLEWCKEFERSIDLISIIDNKNFDEQWKLYFYLLKRILYILINNSASTLPIEKSFLNDAKSVNLDEIWKLVDEINDIEYKIAQLYLSKKDCFGIISIKIKNLCQKKIFI